AATAENTESIAKLKESVGGLEDAIEGTAGSLEASEGRLLKEIGDKAGREEVEGLLRRVKAEAKAPTGPPVDTSAAPELSEITTQLERQLREGLEPLEGNLKDLEARTEARMKGFNVKMEDARKALEENTESIGNRIDSLDLRVSKLEVPSEKTTGPSLDTSTNPVKDTAFEEDIHELRRRMIDVEGLRSEVEVVRRDFQEAARPLLATVVDAGAPSENSSSLMQQLVETCLQWRSEIQKARTSMREQREGSEEVQEALDDCRDRVDALMRDVEAAVGEISRWVAQRRPSEETEIERMFLRIHDEVITEKPLRLVDAARDLCAELSRIRPPRLKIPRLPMDHGRRTSNLLSYLERIRDRARRDVTMGVTPDALRANAEERRRRAARRRERRIIARPAKHSEPIEIENSPRRENVALPEDEGPPIPLVTSTLSAAELEDLLEARTERIQPVKTVRDAAIAPAVLVEWRATVKELLSLVKEAEGNDVPEEELEELRQMVSVDLEENLISPLVAGVLGRLVDQEAAGLHKILLRSTAEAAHNISEDSVEASSLPEIEHLRMKYSVS
ncbi:hypothetical protein FOZ62_025435, partial [Perkinsus olseni]